MFLAHPNILSNQLILPAYPMKSFSAVLHKSHDWSQPEEGPGPMAMPMLLIAGFSKFKHWGFLSMLVDKMLI